MARSHFSPFEHMNLSANAPHNMRDGSIAMLAPAKINLTLHVTGRRPDGYHLLDSLVVFSGVSDHIFLEPDDLLSLTVCGPQAKDLHACPAEETTVMQAARTLAQFTGCTDGARITLVKNLPVSAGIGGGSTDAAAVLHGLCTLWSRPLAEHNLHHLAHTVGADVPVCVHRRPTRMQGVGEILTDLPPLPDFWMVLINPGVPVPTPDVFRAYADGHRPLPDTHSPPPLTVLGKTVEDWVSWLRQGRNDLTKAAQHIAPDISTCLAALEYFPTCLLSRLSGSGATCWGLFSEDNHAHNAARVLQTEHPTWWVVATPVLRAGASCLLPTIYHSQRT